MTLERAIADSGRRQYRAVSSELTDPHYRDGMAAAADAVGDITRIRTAAGDRPLTAAQRRDYASAAATFNAYATDALVNGELPADAVTAPAADHPAFRAFERRAAQVVVQSDLNARAERAAEQRARFIPEEPMLETTDSYSHLYGPRSEHSYFRDLIGAGRGDWEAAQRLHRNNAQEADRERRDGTTGATSMGSFIPPKWLLDETAELARAGRILADLVTYGGEPTTTSITVPRVTTGSSVASQATENTAVSETDIVTAQLTRSTVTIAGQQDVSLQSIELATPLTDRLIFADLRAAYQAELDRQILRGSGASGELLGINQVAGINAVTYTDATPTVPELYPKVADAIQQAAVGRKLPPTAIVMAPRRWAWITASLDTSNRPLVVPSGGSFNSAATFASAAREGRVGEMQGLPVYSDSNVATNLGAGTNEDQILVMHGPSIVLLESGLRTRILQDVLSGTLTLRFQVYTYSSLFAGRYPTAISTIGGTSLVTPTF